MYISVFRYLNYGVIEYMYSFCMTRLLDIDVFGVGEQIATHCGSSPSPAYDSPLLDVGFPPYRGGFANSHHAVQAVW